MNIKQNYSNDGADTLVSALWNLSKMDRDALFGKMSTELIKASFRELVNEREDLFDVEVFWGRCIENAISLAGLDTEYCRVCYNCYCSEVYYDASVVDAETFEKAEEDFYKLTGWGLQPIDN